jgi:hypothetical protein
MQLNPMADLEQGTEKSYRVACDCDIEKRKKSEVVDADCDIEKRKSKVVGADFDKQVGERLVEGHLAMHLERKVDVVAQGQLIFYFEEK